MALRIAEQAHRTDTGRQRTANEDSYFVREPLFVVADGMGGAQAGEVASRIAAEAFEPAERGPEPAEAFLRSVAEGANQEINSLAQGDSTRSGMGTTLTAALVEGEEIAIGHVGDSRAYRYRDGELKLLTSDHSLVEELRRQGRLTDEQAESHPQRSIITRALGPEPDVEVDTMTISARPGDVYLICSDGLTTMLKDERVAEVLAGASSLEEATTWLVNEANAAGGRDNITVVAFRLAEGEGAEARDDDATLVGPTAAAAGLSAGKVRAGTKSASGASLGGAASERRERPQEPAKRRRKAPLLALAALLVAAVLGVGAFLGARQVYFLGTDEGGRLALYRGLPYELPFGLELYSEVISSPTLVESLPVDRRDAAIEHELRSRTDAEDLLRNLEDSVAEPAEPAPPGGSENGSGGSGRKQP